ncbi:hypothetical protein GCM10010420_44770 [Streptomyces glaucosporus]|uniref:Uncharacterized protein n=1 Tax=Streptomyces glaucosporus TaxID=284044 RepID=A0ABN3IPV3_9ACTN
MTDANDPRSKTLVTDRAFLSLARSDAQRIVERDLRRLAVERSLRSPAIAAKMDEPAHSIKKMMQEWERLVNVLESPWETTDYFLLDDYMFALDTRASLEKELGDFSPAPPTPLLIALEGLDARFLAQTVREEPGQERQLQAWLKPLSGRPPEWLWNRRPRVMPW